MLRTFLVLATILVVGLVDVALATAQSSSDDRARIHFEAGRNYFDEGRYERALEEFERAYELSGRPELHYNLYIVCERLGRWQDAIAHLDAFLATNPPEADTLRARLENLRAREADRTATEAENERRRAEAEQRAREAEQRARAAETEAARTRPAEEERTGLHPLAITGYALAGAGLATFAVAGSLVVARDGDFHRGCVLDGTCTNAELDRQDRRALVADIGLGIGVGAAITAVITHVVTRRSEEPTRTALVAPSVGREGSFGAVIAGRF